ncbi:hypothetical protein ASF61_06895 [Duganella sp. Leaf126]|uniref:hypothetical protein n=1 Tax=Duganella sp. Leaf126 TaxID=1736266 RepID=UPI0006F8EAEE|nr:hypothetical protein [Duganella sp. Leaf126]KQQ40474.1 hypothetical protein ASF61_06895 [Duganella sp. Leaf126]
MPGFQCFNSAGNFQIDGVFKNYVLDRVIEVVVVSEALQGFPTSVRVGRTPINPGEIVAIRSAYPSAVASVSDGKLEVHQGRENVPNNAIVTCYFFAPISTSNATSGLQVFHEVSGDLLFCASKKPIRVVRVVDGHGDFSLDVTRTYATVLINQYYRLITGGFTQNNQGTKTIQAERSMVIPLSTGLRIETTVEIFGAAFNGAPGERQPEQASSTSVGVAKHLIIDVTGYA